MIKTTCCVLSSSRYVLMLSVSMVTTLELHGYHCFHGYWHIGGYVVIQILIYVVMWLYLPTVDITPHQSIIDSSQEKLFVFALLKITTNGSQRREKHQWSSHLIYRQEGHVSHTQPTNTNIRQFISFFLICLINIIYIFNSLFKYVFYMILFF